MNNNIYLSIIIPAYNEEERLSPTLSTIRSYCDAEGYEYEVIVVDDGSSDSTAVKVLKDPLNKAGRLRLLRNGQNHGKGYSIKRAIIASEGEYLLLCDADMSTPIEGEKKLFAAINKGYDIAIGSRSIKGADIRLHQPFYREYMGKIFNGLVRLFVLKGIIDTQCGFKLMKKAPGKEIAKRLKIERFAFDVELLYLARRKGYSIKEVPVVWINSPASRVNPIRDSYNMLKDLLFIKRLHNAKKQV